MLVPKVSMAEFEKVGFRRCKDHYGKADCYYLCVARGKKMIFVSPVIVSIMDWEIDDPRVHKKANCRYSDNRTAMDILYELIKADMVCADYCLNCEAKRDEVRK